MGYDAACTLRVDGASARGTALLEHKQLVFRGPTRLAIPLAEIRSATAEGGVLRVRFGNRSAELEIGEQASKWAARIANPPSRLDKLGVKPGMRVFAGGVRDASFSSELKERGAVAVSRRPSPAARVHLLFHPAEDRRALTALSSLKHTIEPDGAIWIVRPKGSRAITEAETMAAGKQAGLVDVKVVSFSETHTAEKFVIPVVNRPKAPRRAGRARS